MEGLYIYINLVLLCNDIGGPSLYISTGLPHCNCWRSLWGSSHGKGFRAIIYWFIFHRLTKTSLP
jgi:hypothetical protein